MSKQMIEMDFGAIEQRAMAHMGSQEPTMSSKQITELLNEGKPKDEWTRHDSVKRTMERLQDREVITFTPMVEPIPGGGKPLTTYLVNERDSYITVAQLSPEFAAAIVDHWRQLKGENLDLKALVFEQGKKIDMLCERLFTPTLSIGKPVAAGIKGHKGKRMVRNYDVIEIKALAQRGHDKHEVAQMTGFGPQTVFRVIQGYRDYLLKA